MPDKYTLLKRYWGFDSFRPLQEEIVDSVLNGNDTLALLPTGGGKTLCYQLPALLREGSCIVVSPLVALMKEQVERLNERRLKAACLVAGMRAEEATAVLNNAVTGQLKFLYVSPERLRQRRFIEHLRKMKVGLIAVDEAHCISQWGHDFRPPYLQVGEIRLYHPSAPLIALTATATPEVQEDIRQHLAMHNCRTIVGSFRRPNIAYAVQREGDKVAAMMRTVHRMGGCGIVYVRSRRMTQAVAQQLTDAGISATYYHAGLDTAERDRRQSQWMQGTFRVMVATNAFGMGIDKPDVRFVVHLDIPDSVEAYFQESGRAGRDGLPAAAVLVCDASDDFRQERNFADDFPTLKYIRNVYRALCNYYKLPMGSGADTHHDFDMEGICATYNFRIREFYNACRFLERDGLVSMPDREDVSSTLYIPIARDELYRFQVNHMALGNLLQVLLRLYPGLLSVATAIDEERVASRSMLDVPDVVAMLKQLHEMRVVVYTPRPTKPQIVFLSERINENDILMNDSGYNTLKEAARRRLDAMQRYVDTTDVCRSRQLLAYFGEHQDEDCGCCDVCRRSGHSTAETERAVRQVMGEGRRMTVNEVVDRLPLFDAAGVRAILRRMLDMDELRMDTDLRLYEVH